MQEAQHVWQQTQQTLPTKLMALSSAPFHFPTCMKSFKNKLKNPECVNNSEYPKFTSSPSTLKQIVVKQLNGTRSLFGRQIQFANFLNET